MLTWLRSCCNSFQLYPSDWPTTGAPLAILQASLRPSIQRIITVNREAIYEGDASRIPECALLANGKPTSLFDNLLIADYLFR